MAHVSPIGRQMIEELEGGPYLHAYQDSIGIWTIGYGHTHGVTPDLVITSEQADQFLSDDLTFFEKSVENLLARPASQAQFDAMVSFAFNIGVRAFSYSGVLKAFNDPTGIKLMQAALDFPEWIDAGGALVLGLVRRRVREMLTFLEIRP